MSQRKFGYTANCWGPLGGNSAGVTPVTQFVCRSFADMPQASAEISEAGYDGVELFAGDRIECIAGAIIASGETGSWTEVVS
jgi:inosose dehydratase